MKDTPIDPRSLAVEPQTATRAMPIPPPRRISGTFLRGPVPWGWLVRAGRLPGRALQVATYVWFKVGCANAMTVSISLTAAATEFACDRSSMSRALAALARDGLVAVQRRAGRKVDVTIHIVEQIATEVDLGTQHVGTAPDRHR